MLYQINAVTVSKRVPNITVHIVQAFQPGSAALCAPIRTGVQLLPNYLNLFVQNRRYQPS